MALKLESDIKVRSKDSPDLVSNKDSEDKAAISDPKFECNLCYFKSDIQITTNHWTS